MIINLKSLAGQQIVGDPIRYITIAVDAFDDICQQYFLLCYKIVVVKLPGNDVRFKMKINWLNELMRTEYITRNHALNCHRLSACEMYVPIQPHFKDKQQHHCSVKAFIFMAVQIL